MTKPTANRGPKLPTLTELRLMTKLEWKALCLDRGLRAHLEGTTAADAAAAAASTATTAATAGPGLRGTKRKSPP